MASDGSNCAGGRRGRLGGVFGAGRGSTMTGSAGVPPAGAAAGAISRANAQTKMLRDANIGIPSAGSMLLKAAASKLVTSPVVNCN